MIVMTREGGSDTMHTVIWNGTRYHFTTRRAMRRFIMRRVFGNVNA